MYHHLRGKLIELNPTLAVVEAGGVGYAVRIPLTAYEALKGRTEVLLYTSVQVRENSWRLFGFLTREERDLFELVQSVNGVGPAIALAALSSLSAEVLAGALASGDVAQIQKIKGVGRKLAERLVLELSERTAALGFQTPGGREAVRGTPAAAADRRVAEAIDALIELGYSRRAAREKVECIWEGFLDREGSPKPGTKVEDLIRAALRGS